MSPSGSRMHTSGTGAAARSFWRRASRSRFSGVKADGASYSLSARIGGTERRDITRPPTRAQARSRRRTPRLGAAQMLVEARHDLDEIARPVTIVELVLENPVPGVAAGAGRAGQTENVGRAGNARGGARLHRRGADLL